MVDINEDIRLDIVLLENHHRKRKTILVSLP